MSGRRQTRSRTGAKAAKASFVAEKRGNPLDAFPELLLESRPYNLWLTDRILIVVLRRWSDCALDGRERADSISRDVDWASERCGQAFRAVLPTAAALGDPALLAALAVTANLQRTLGCLGKFLLSPAPKRRARFGLSRWWCGLIDYPADAACFPSRVSSPTHPSRLHLGRKDARHLANALWCSAGSVHARCDEAMATLRAALLRGGHCEPADLRLLHSASLVERFRRDGATSGFKQD